MKRSVSIICPAMNEEHNLRAAVEGIQTAAIVLDDWEIVIVDDGSDDGTGWVADSLARSDPRIRALHHESNRGLRAAYETGLAAATMPYVCWIPGDGEMATESIWAIFKAVGTAKLVIPYHGTPERRPWFRRLLTWGSTIQLNVLLGQRLHYWQGPTVMRTEMARRLPRTESGFFFNSEQLAWALEEGCSYVEVPLIHQERQHGVSKAVGFRQILRAQMLILRLAFRIHVDRMANAAQWALLG